MLVDQTATTTATTTASVTAASTTSVTTTTTTSVTTTTTTTLETTTQLPATTTTSTGTATADKRLAAFWDHDECDQSGDNQNWDWCGRGDFECPQSRSVPTSICPSGRAKLVSSKTFVKVGKCYYAYYAQYACEEPDSRLAAYWDLGSCGPAGDDQNWDWCSAWKFQCPEQRQVSQEICASGVAVRVQMESFVKKDSCYYAYHAQYACQDDSSMESLSIDMGSEHGNRRLRGPIPAEEAVPSLTV